MARLNDPPAPPTESIDALKRRFIRQNREIARVNSTQSQRIRNLESEISRLLAENIALREQAIAAAAEAERWRTATSVGEDVADLKMRLESKLCEVNTLVEELGNLPERAARRSSTRRRKSAFVQSSVTSPDRRDWRARQTMSNTVTAEGDTQDGRLPAIVEGKYYPRRTMEAEELRILTATTAFADENTESPDLGPPPIVHFDVADPVMFDSARSLPRVSGGIEVDDEDGIQLPKNLETRRKRRTSSLLHDTSGLLETESEQPPLLKSNAKRKFDVSEIEIEPSRPTQIDDFEFSRKESSLSRPKPSRFTAKPVDRGQHSEAEQPKTSPRKELQPRKALAAKSTNSPTKRASLIDAKKHGVAKVEENVYTKPAAGRGANSSRLRVELPRSEEHMDDHVGLPQTPAPALEDMMSPPTSAVDTSSRPKSTEAAITNSVEDVLNGSIGRGSRRARAAVSYAEPNLRDKMRRPDKKLVGAVEGIAKPASLSDRESSGGDMLRERSTEPSHSAIAKRTVKIKSEENPSSGDWKDLPTSQPNEEPASPLQNKEISSTSSNNAARKKRTFSESEGSTAKPRHTATASNSTTTVEQDALLDDAVSRLSIYDPPTSSPISKTPMTTNTTTAKTSSSTQLPTTTKSRRHSSAIQPNPSSLNSNLSALTSPYTVPAKETTNSSVTQTQTQKLKRASSVQVLTQPGQPGSGLTRNAGGVGVKSTVTATAGAEKSLGPRRRSMMV